MSKREELAKKHGDWAFEEYGTIVSLQVKQITEKSFEAGFQAAIEMLSSAEASEALDLEFEGTSTSEVIEWLESKKGEL